LLCIPGHRTTPIAGQHGELQIGAHFGVELLFDMIFANQITPEIGEATHVEP
jgi:hypothetical protein